MMNILYMSNSRLQISVFFLDLENVWGEKGGKVKSWADAAVEGGAALIAVVASLRL
jgi:hypothetical protein